MIFQIFRRIRPLLARLLCVGISTIFLTQCSTMEPAPENADNLFKEAETAFTDGRHLIAIERFRDIKNRFPYSSKAIEAELRIADSHFALENYMEAEGAYEVFRELHPSHPKSDYVAFQIAMCHYNQIPSTPARDLTPAQYAMEAFTRVWQKFPESEFAQKSKDFFDEARRKLAEYEKYVAEFYFDRRHYLSASYRYAALLQEYPGLGFDEQALFRLGYCYYNVRMYSNAKDAFQRLNNQYPNGSFKSQAEGLLAEMSKN